MLAYSHLRRASSPVYLWMDELPTTTEQLVQVNPKIEVHYASVAAVRHSDTTPSLGWSKICIADSRCSCNVLMMV